MGARGGRWLPLITPGGHPNDFLAVIILSFDGIIAAIHHQLVLYATPKLDDNDRRALAEIEGFRRQLRYQLAEPRRWQGQLRRTLTARAIQGSNSIEGYRVSLDDAEDV